MVGNWIWSIDKKENICIIVLDMYIKKTVQRNKNGKERVYLQLAESYRVGDKVKQRIICTLGSRPIIYLNTSNEQSDHLID